MPSNFGLQLRGPATAMSRNVTRPDDCAAFLKFFVMCIIRKLQVRGTDWVFIYVGCHWEGQVFESRGALGREVLSLLSLAFKGLH